MMIHRIRYILFLLAVGVFGACTDEDREVVQSGQTVTRELAISVADMQTPDGAPVTRSAQSDDEKRIDNLYVVQFDGTESTAKVAAAGAITLDAANKVNFTFAAPATAGACRIYVVANFTPTVTVGTTTLAEFEKMGATYTPQSAADTPNSIPLPMSGYVDLDLQTITTIPTVTLTAMVAKLTFDYQASSGLFVGDRMYITFNSAANSTSIGVPGSYATAQRPTDIQFVDKINISSGIYYVAENLAGQVSGITDWTGRTVNTAPANAFYVELSGLISNGNLVTIASYIGDPRTPGDFNIRRNTEYRMNALVNDLDESDERIAIIPHYNLNVGGKSANCYIATGNEGGKTQTFYGFDCTKRGNGYESTTDANVSGISYSTLPDLTTATEARVIWEQGSAKGAVVKSVKLNNDKVLFELGTATEGNAVIGIFASSAANAPCLWSWHIWRLNGGVPADVACTKYLNGDTGNVVSFKMMPFNLGAFNNTPGNAGSIGLFYQWGRKDPFPGPAKFINSDEPNNIYGSWYNGGTTGSWTGTYSLVSYGGGNEKVAVQYPAAFITGLIGNNNSDWYYSDSGCNNNLWGTPWVAGGVNDYNGNQGTKSIYDPCPIGYRVPPQDTWSMQTPGTGTWLNYGTVLGSVASGFWFPAPGYRNFVGNFLYVASAGRYWTSSPKDAREKTEGGSLYTFTGGGVSPHSSFQRANGCNVRCVAE